MSAVGSITCMPKHTISEIQDNNGSYELEKILRLQFEDLTQKGWFLLFYSKDRNLVFPTTEMSALE